MICFINYFCDYLHGMTTCSIFASPKTSRHSNSFYTFPCMESIPRVLWFLFFNQRGNLYMKADSAYSCNRKLISVARHFQFVHPIHEISLCHLYLILLTILSGQVLANIHANGVCSNLH